MSNPLNEQIESFHTAISQHLRLFAESWMDVTTQWPTQNSMVSPPKKAVTCWTERKSNSTN